MLGEQFYHDLIRKHIILFGNTFNDIYIDRVDSSNNDIAHIKVPLSYSAKDKMLARLEQDPNIDRQSAILLPRMAFELKTMTYDRDRKCQTVNRFVGNDTDTTRRKYSYNEIPYNYDFQLAIYVKNAEDATRIVEQILPFFAPDWTSSVHILPELNITKDIPIILTSINEIEDTYTGDFKTRRAIVWTLNFTVKGFIYGPVYTQTVIKFANTSFYIPDDKYNTISEAIGKTAAIDRVTVQPGLTANGQPTTIANNSINRNLIIATDDFGYIDYIAGIL